MDQVQHNPDNRLNNFRDLLKINNEFPAKLGRDCLWRIGCWWDQTDTTNTDNYGPWSAIQTREEGHVQHNPGNRLNNFRDLLK